MLNDICERRGKNGTKPEGSHLNDYAGRQVKQYDEAEDLFIFSPYPPNYAHYGGPTFVVYKKDGKPDYYAGSWYDPFPYDLKPVPPNWDDD